VLEICQEIETELGRVRTGAQYNEKGERIYQSRCIDIDILSMEKQNGEKWEAVVVDTPDLTIPHPQLKTRPFARDLYRVLKK
jgi:2-amino-4-hydroxy-6-hydroxymethyldihydropteridine diphosphokinase